MPAGPVGSCWASGAWDATAWEAASWADAVPVAVVRPVRVTPTFTTGPTITPTFTTGPTITPRWGADA